MQSIGKSVIVVGCWSVMACGGTTKPEGTAPDTTATPTATAPDAPSIMKADFPAKLSAAICNGSKDCCGATGARFDQAACEAEVTKMWTDTFAESKGFDGAAATRCLGALEPLAKACDAGSAVVLEIPDCQAAFQDAGKGVPTGGPCTESIECAPPKEGHAFCWTGAMADEPGRCAVEVKGAAGKACFHPDAKVPANMTTFAECGTEPGLRCDPKTTQCAPKAKTGEVCSAHGDCASPDVCRNGKCTTLTGKACKESRECGDRERCVSGKCGPGAKIGEACASLTDCAEGSCAASTKKCSSWAGAFVCAP